MGRSDEPPRPGLTGRWVVTVDFFGTPQYLPMELTQQGDGLTGTFDGDKLEGTVHGTTIHLLAKDPEGGTEEATGTLAGSTLKGTIILVEPANPKHPATHGFTATLVPRLPAKSPRRHEFTPTGFYRQFSAQNQPVLTISPGDTIVTATVAAAGTDASGVKRVLGGIVPRAGPDGRDPSCPPVAPAREPAVAGLRIAVHRQTLDGALRGDVAAARDAAARALAAAGCLIAEDDVLDVAHALDITRRYWGRARLPTGEVEQLLHDWDRSRLGAMRLLDRYDAILSPAAPHPAPPLGAGDDADWTYTLSASLWGWPALVVPAGRSVEGLPLGVQLIAGPWCEGTCLALGEIVERAAPI